MPKKTKAQTEIKSLASQALIEAQGDKTTAMGLLRLSLNPVWESMVDSVIYKGLSTLIDEAGHSTRTIDVKALAMAKQNPASLSKDAIQSSMNAAKESILDSWFVNGKPLGDNNKNDLSDEAGRLLNQARGAKQKAAFYNSLSKLLKGDEILRSKATDDKVTKVWSLSLDGG